MHTLWRLLIRMQWELFAQNRLKEGAFRRQTALFRSVGRPTKFRCRLEALAEIGASFFLDVLPHGLCLKLTGRQCI